MLLDTEKLILEHKEALGHDKKEASMILNHKDAFNYIHENKSHFSTLSKQNLQDLHAIITYEINSIVPFKKIFIDQYDFAARNYAVK